MEISEETLASLLRRWPVARLATVTPDGHPHVLPVVFGAAGGCAYTPVDGKRKGTSRLARVRNVEAHGRASLLLDHYDEDWSRLWWVRLDGPAWVERGDQELLRQAAADLRAKYPQYRQVDTFTRDAILLVLRWQRVAAWSQAGDEAPVHRALDTIER